MFERIKIVSFLLLLPFTLISREDLLASVDNDLGYISDVQQEKPLVVIIPSYNNKRWYEKNLASVFSQKYSNYRVIYIDDASTDSTVEKVKLCIYQYAAHDRCELVINTHRIGALANYYKAIHSCGDDEIVIALDGDDWLAHDEVFAYINRVYQDDNVWLTWGQFVEFPSRTKGFAADFPIEVVKNNSYRKNGMPVSHLRTFYTWLFKLVDVDDLKYKGKFFSMTWDKAMMAPMIEMAGGRYKFIDDILYVYNFSNPINDCRKNGALQVAMREEIYARRPYMPLESKIVTGKRTLLRPD